MVYPLVAGAGAVYGYCPASCASADDVWTVVFPTDDFGGGWTSPDPTKPACVTGVDMSMTRLAVLDSY